MVEKGALITAAPTLNLEKLLRGRQLKLSAMRVAFRVTIDTTRSTAADAGLRRLQRLEALGPERARFRELIAKVGSGEHTSTGLSRDEARDAMDLMLQGQASDAQLGAFLIAHRIRRPLPIELTGMLDSYRSHGPKLETPGRQAICFGVPYDGRSRTAPCCPCSP